MNDIQIDAYSDSLGRSVSVLDPDAFPFKAIAVERRGRDALILRRLDEPCRRFDGKRASYELEYRWLSQDGDDGLACVRGSEVSLWQRREIKPRGHLFEQFDLF
ncbi:MAG TPA: hypothetical protein VFA48_06245 [Gammaproteobacteria bacterium]|nr:hypothetical protein [Gammaproteobacteria bacterium]